MISYSPDIYRQLEEKIDDCRRLHTHLLIITLPGIGTSHLLRHYITNHPQEPVAYINTANQEVSEYNFLDLDFDANPQALSQAIYYFQKVDYRQKIALVVNTPFILTSPEYLQSTLPRHLLNHFYLSAYSFSDTQEFLHIDYPELSTSEAKKTYQLSGGICRLSKFLLTHRHLLELSAKEIISSPEVVPIITPTANSIHTTPANILEKLNITQDQKIASALIAAVSSPSPTTINIQINPDPSFTENYQPSTSSLNKVDAKTLQYLIENNGFINREKVAEIKWGGGKYDDFSDLAISKTMLRLKRKLTAHTIKTIPKTGWQLTSKVNS